MNISAVNGTGTVPSPGRQLSRVREQGTYEGKSPRNQDTFTHSVPIEDHSEPLTYQPQKLTAEQVDSLKRQVKDSMLALVEKMLGTQAEVAKLADGSVDFDALAKQLGMGTTPETAAAAIREGGMWGVDAVSTRLMDMALSLTQGNPELAGEMREAIQKGFEAVGGLDSLPQVCQDTYQETMKRLDYWEKNGSMEGYEYTPG